MHWKLQWCEWIYSWTIAALKNGKGTEYVKVEIWTQTLTIKKVVSACFKSQPLKQMSGFIVCNNQPQHQLKASTTLQTQVSQGLAKLCVQPALLLSRLFTSCSHTLGGMELSPLSSTFPFLERFPAIFLLHFITAGRKLHLISGKNIAQSFWFSSTIAQVSFWIYLGLLLL